MAEDRGRPVIPLFRCHHCREDFPTQLARVEHKLDLVIEQNGKIMTDQQHLDADVAELGTALTNISDEIVALKNQPGAPALDFTALDAAVAQAQGLAPAPAAPADGTTAAA